MIDIKDKGYCPTLEEIGEYIGNPVFMQFCSDMKAQYDCVGKTEFSSCSWMPGWNVKFKKAGKNLCTVSLTKDFPKETIDDAIEYNPAHAGITTEQIDVTEKGRKFDTETLIFLRYASG